jgi:hypothetical protein
MERFSRLITQMAKMTTKVSSDATTQNPNTVQLHSPKQINKIDTLLHDDTADYECCFFVVVAILMLMLMLMHLDLSHSR